MATTRNSTSLRALLVPVGAYLACLGVAILALIATATLTARWGGGRTGDALMLMLGGDALLFLLSTLLVFVLLGRSVPSLPVRAAICGGYFVVSAGTLMLLAVFSAIAFNR